MTTPPIPPSHEIEALFCDIDIYLFDQLARGRLDTRRRVLDVGCGEGRNIRYLLSRGYDCWAIDRDPRALARLTRFTQELTPSAPADRFFVGEADALPWPDAAFDVVICSAMLHFANDAAHFGRMVTEMWRVLGGNGLFFARLASTIGLDGFSAVAGQRVRLPDGSDRFVVDEAMLLDWTSRLGATLADPLKTTNVQGQRAMTTWTMWK